MSSSSQVEMLRPGMHSFRLSLNHLLTLLRALLFLHLIQIIKQLPRMAWAYSSSRYRSPQRCVRTQEDSGYSPKHERGGEAATGAPQGTNGMKCSRTWTQLDWTWMKVTARMENCIESCTWEFGKRMTTNCSPFHKYLGIRYWGKWAI
jgi:hypothetical protein